MSDADIVLMNELVTDPVKPGMEINEADVELLVAETISQHETHPEEPIEMDDIDAELMAIETSHQPRATRPKL